MIQHSVLLKPEYVASQRREIVKNLELDVSLDFSSGFASNSLAFLILKLR